jgi:hypothetical protein
LVYAKKNGIPNQGQKIGGHEKPLEMRKPGPRAFPDSPVGHKIFEGDLYSVHRHVIEYENISNRGKQ